LTDAACDYLPTSGSSVSASRTTSLWSFSIKKCIEIANQRMNPTHFPLNLKSLSQSEPGTVLQEPFCNHTRALTQPDPVLVRPRFGNPP